MIAVIDVISVIYVIGLAHMIDIDIAYVIGEGHVIAVDCVFE